MRSVASALVVGLLCLAGCTQAPSVSGKQRDFTTKAVVSLSPSTTEVYCTFANCSGLVGKTSSCDYPPQAQTKGQVVVDGTTPDFQAIAALKPDLIIYDADLYGPQVVQKIEALGVKTLPMKAKTLESFFEFRKALTALVGGETNASSNSDRVMAEVNTQYGITSSLPNKPTAAIAMLDGTLLAAGDKSFMADLYGQCGVKFVGPAGDKFVEWNVEELIKADPNAILTTPGGSAKFKADPRFQSLRAVKNDDVIEVRPEVLLRVGDRLESLVKATVSRIAKAASR